jgi:hypothetical protein
VKNPTIRFFPVGTVGDKFAAGSACASTSWLAAIRTNTATKPKLLLRAFHLVHTSKPSTRFSRAAKGVAAALAGTQKMLQFCDPKNKPG